jgi:hypothetical protein
LGATEYRIGDLGRSQLELPKYQRALVWRPGQKQTLIDSLYRGYPVGALLLWEVPGSNPKVFQVIDGQQRVNAIREYLARPLAYLGVLTKLLPESVLASLVAALNEAMAAVAPDARALTEAECRSAVSGWMTDTEVNDIQRGFDAVTLLRHVLNSAEVGEDIHAEVILHSEAQSAANAVIAHVLAEKDKIENRTVPAIIYDGVPEALPTVFERVNTQLTTLKEFDKYAAAWSHHVAVVSDRDISHAIQEKYRAQLAAGYEIEGVELQAGGSIHVSEYNLYECFFGLGKKLKAQYPLLFGSMLAPSDPEPAGFVLPATVHGVGYTELEKLAGVADAYYRTPAGTYDITRLTNALCESCAFVESVLLPRVGYKFNSKDGASYVQGHTLYQAMSLVAAAFVYRYDPTTLDVRSDWRTTKQKLARTIAKHYLLDIVSGVWSGHGNLTLLERVWADREKAQLSAHYITDVTKEQLKSALDSWFELQMQRQHTTRGIIEKDSKAFLAYVYSDLIKVRQLAEGDWEIAHVFPVKRLSNAIGDSAGWPMNCVGNLALFSKEVNREQSKQTLPEYLAALRSAATREKRQAEIEPLLLCDMEDTAMPKGFKRPTYEAAVRKRFQVMRDGLLTTLAS